MEAAIVLPSPSTPLAAGALLRSTLGFAALGAVAMLARPESLSAGLSTGLFSPLGAGLLTCPALLVVHPFLGLKAAPSALLSALATAWQRTGDLALGLAPALLLYSATSGSGPGVFLLFLYGAGFYGLLGAAIDLYQAERATQDDPALLVRMVALVAAWMLLAGLIGLRVSASSFDILFPCKEIPCSC